MKWNGSGNPILYSTVENPAQATGCSCLVSDEVTEMVRLTPLVSFASLQSSPEDWAANAQAILSKDSPRRSWTGEIRDAGYDIRDAARRLTDHYLSRIEAWERKGGRNR